MAMVMGRQQRFRLRCSLLRAMKWGSQILWTSRYEPACLLELFITLKFQRCVFPVCVNAPLWCTARCVGVHCARLDSVVDSALCLIHCSEPAPLSNRFISIMKSFIPFILDLDASCALQNLTLVCFVARHPSFHAVPPLPVQASPSSSTHQLSLAWPSTLPQVRGTHLQALNGIV